MNYLVANDLVLKTPATSKHVCIIERSASKGLIESALCQRSQHPKNLVTNKQILQVEWSIDQLLLSCVAYS